MAIILMPETESRLREKAEQEGRDPEALVNAVLLDYLNQGTQEHEEDAAAIQEGRNAIAAGRWKPISQFLAEQRDKRGLPASWPASVILKEDASGVTEAG